MWLIFRKFDLFLKVLQPQLENMYILLLSYEHE